MSRGTPFTSKDEFVTFLKSYAFLVRKHRWLFVKALVFIFSMQLLALVEPWVSMKVVDAITTKDATFESLLLVICFAYFLAKCGISFVAKLKNAANRMVIVELEKHIPLDVGGKVLAFELPYFHQRNAGSLTSSMTRGMNRLASLTQIYLWSIFPLVIEMLVAVTVLLFIDWIVVLVLLSIVALFSYITISAKLRLAPLRKVRHELAKQADSILGESIVNIQTTKSYVQERRELERFAQKQNRVAAIIYDEFGQYDWVDWYRNCVVGFGQVTVVYICAQSAFASVLTIGQVLFVMTVCSRVFANCYMIGNIIDQTFDAKEPVGEIAKMAQSDAMLPEIPAVIPRFKGDLELRDVHFSYRDSDGNLQKALHGVSMKIAAGKTVALVGQSGSGKSTLAQLLLAFYKPDSGRILLDGVDIQELPVAVLRKNVVAVHQHTDISNATIAENIAYGAPAMCDVEIVQAARLAQAHEFIEKLPQKYSTMVGERGMKLSGGQRQRVGYARALAVGAPVLVLDEATSSVDTETEVLMQQSFEKVREGRTTIVIAHRLSTIRNADEIVVLSEGRVVERGTHDELVARRGAYHKLVTLQSTQKEVL